MDRIHRKSAISKTSELILSFHDQGEDLLWGRYERQVPLCAFTENGLSCRKCFHGPCRINPFGDEPDRGICGADRDQIVMETLFQATLGGVLDQYRSDSTGDNTELPEIAPDFPQETLDRLSKAGLIPVCKNQLWEVQNSYFSHKGYLTRTLRDLTRLGLIQYGLLKRREGASGGEEGLWTAAGANILIAAQPPASLITALKKQAAQKNRTINLLGQGATFCTSIPLIVDHGTPELALAMGLDCVIIGPNASLPALGSLAEKVGVPVVLFDEAKSVEQISSRAIELAFGHKERASSGGQPLPRAGNGLEKAENSILVRGAEVKAALKTGQIRGVVIILGETNVKQTFFERTLTLMEKCLDQSCLIILGGELAAQADLLQEELKKGMAARGSTRMGQMEKLGLPSLTSLGSFSQIPKVVAFLRNLGEDRGFASLPAVVAFPEFYRTSTWATAVSFLALGCAVQIGVRLPFWGSPALSDILMRDWPLISGGTLLASPTLPDSQAQAQELISFLDGRKF